MTYAGKLNDIQNVLSCSMTNKFICPFFTAPIKPYTVYKKANNPYEGEIGVDITYL